MYVECNPDIGISSAYDALGWTYSMNINDCVGFDFQAPYVHSDPWHDTASFTKLHNIYMIFLFQMTRYRSENSKQQI